jgi:hypothetical protein
VSQQQQTSNTDSSRCCMYATCFRSTHRHWMGVCIVLALNAADVAAAAEGGSTAATVDKFRLDKAEGVTQRASSLSPALLCWLQPLPTLTSRRHRSGWDPPTGRNGRIPTLLLSNPLQLLSHFTRRRLSPVISLQLFPCALSMVSVGAYPVHILVHLQPSCSAEEHQSPRWQAVVADCQGLPTPSALVQRDGQCYQMLLENHCCSISPFLAHIHNPIQPHDARPKGRESNMKSCLVGILKPKIRDAEIFFKFKWRSFL